MCSSSCFSFSTFKVSFCANTSAGGGRRWSAIETNNSQQLSEIFMRQVHLYPILWLRESIVVEPEISRRLLAARCVASHGDNRILS